MAVKKKVFVGLSGGVDSAVSAALLKQQGYEVIGVFIKTWVPDFVPCTWRAERRDAMRVAAHLEIPFLFFDFEDEYKKSVADYMIEAYRQGLTPNPDVMCNREIKFGAFWKKAKEMGADFIATGHYAQNIDTQLLEGKDVNKNQSYFLWTLTKGDLEHVLFPVGHLEKPEVRKLAKQFDLPVAEKKDSQGICFIGEVSMDEFLSHFVTTKPGDVLDTAGNVIGIHKGALYFTIGERHGFEVIKKSPRDLPYYVVSKDMTANTITVSNNEKEILDRAPAKIHISNLNWITEPTTEKITARIRYRGEKLPIQVTKNDTGCVVEFQSPQRGLSLGQSIVFYEAQEGVSTDICLGGGVMDAILF